MIDFAVVDHALHQRQRLVGDAKTERRIARGEARDAQHAHRILGERGRNMAQHACLEIARAAERIDQAALVVLGHRVDRQIAAFEILLERHRRIGREHEAVIAAPALALGARERVFLARLRMQEHREIAADRAKAEARHRLRRRADDDIVAIDDIPAEQLVADGAADEVGLHHLT